MIAGAPARRVARVKLQNGITIVQTGRFRLNKNARRGGQFLPSKALSEGKVLG
jgi:hypothetical protein